MRVLTVGLNPSLQEFPKDSPFRRFPLAENVTADQPGVYLGALCAYFRTDACPYSRWFGAYEPLLNGLQTSYYGGQPSTALHTDICSPVATDPTWRRLGRDARRALEHDGVPLWHDLLNVLNPQVVAISVAGRHLQQVAFRPLSNWMDAHAFDETGDGVPRAQPVQVWTRWYEVGGESSLFVFMRAAQTPLGFLGDRQKREAGSHRGESGAYGTVAKRGSAQRIFPVRNSGIPLNLFQGPSAAPAQGFDAPPAVS